MAQHDLELKITILGPQGAGKSTLLRSFARQLRESRLIAGFAVDFDDHALLREVGRYPAATPDGNKPLTGRLTAYTTVFPLYITDRPGSELETPAAPATPTGADSGPADPTRPPALLSLSGQSHLLILVFDPQRVADRTALDRTFQWMRPHVEAMKRTNPRAVVAIAYTKADEYGLVGEAPTAFIRTTAQRRAFLEWLRAAQLGYAQEGSLWEAFVRLVSETDLRTDPWAGARRQVLTLTKPIWEGLVRTCKIEPDAVNGYFITAVPADDYTDPFPVDRTGIPQLFLDFFQKVCERYNRPAWPWWGSLAAAVAGVAVFAVGLGLVFGAGWLYLGGPVAALLGGGGLFWGLLRRD
jgi:hypothetical protein